jgi:hypothetical protein
MTVRNMMIISVVIILVYSKDAILYCLNLMSRDSLFNYIIDRKTLINTCFCIQSDRTVLINVTHTKSKKRSLE